MKPEIARLAMQFMQRLQLQGNEVPAFNAVMHELTIAAEKPPAAPTKEAQA